MAEEKYKTEDEEEILDLDDNNSSKESMFYHKLRKKDKKIKNSQHYNNNTIIYVVSMVALGVIWFTAFAQPLAHNNRLLLFNNNRRDNNRNNDNSNNSNTSNNSNVPENSSSNVRKSDSSIWNVGFVNMKLSGRIGNCEEIEKPSYTKSKASFHVSLNEPGDEISYDIDIKNSGTIDAKVSDIIINPITEISDPILFVFSGLEVGDELDAGKTTTVSVKIRFNPSYVGSRDRISKDFVVLINYIQK